MKYWFWLSVYFLSPILLNLEHFCNKAYSSNANTRKETEAIKRRSFSQRFTFGKSPDKVIVSVTQCTWIRVKTDKFSTDLNIRCFLH